MAHVIAESDIERLASLTGVSNFHEWTRQLDDGKIIIPRLVSGGVQTAWNACLPYWIEQGRVRDLSRRVRVPKYWPSLANTLGSEFAEQFWTEHEFLIKVLQQHASNTVEYLIACDLLLLMVIGYAELGASAPDALFKIQQPVPAVIRCELEIDPERVWSIGDMLRSEYAENSLTE